jgi:hypothetical protein
MLLIILRKRMIAQQPVKPFALVIIVADSATR